MIVQSFRSRFHKEPELIVRAPGRVNIIGEHTDYNDGFVLPAAIDKEMTVAIGRSPSPNQVQIYSSDYDELDTFNLDAIAKSSETKWSDYARGVFDTLKHHGFRLEGCNLAISGNVPQGAGLSSSAAYEVAIATALNILFRLNIDPTRIAVFAQQSENNFIGMKCGIMDQYISAMGQADSALLIDCRSLQSKSVPLNLRRNNLSIVITHSGVRRGLVDSEYNRRRTECEQGVELLRVLLHKRIDALRDVSMSEFQQHESSLPYVVAQRCRHVISENERVLEAATALEQNDMKKLGQLLYASHESLKNDFQVSTPELDLLVSLLSKHQGVVGARMTGAGFGGCVVALMDTNSITSYMTKVIVDYEKQSGKKAQVYVCSAAAGAGVVSSDELAA